MPPRYMCPFLLPSAAAAGAVLVFLPSWQSIVDVYDALAGDPSVFDRVSIFALHSSLPINEQQEVFQHTPPGESSRRRWLGSWGFGWGEGFRIRGLCKLELGANSTRVPGS